MKSIDLRVRMAAMLFIAAGVLVFKTEYAVYLCLLFVVAWTGLIIGFKKIVPQVSLFIVLEIALFLIRDLRTVGNLPLLLVYLRRLVIAVIAAYPVAKAPVGKLIASLDKMKVPRAATISLAVLFRYLPTVGTEYKAIRRAQRYRGLGVSLKTVILHIPQLFEYTMVPLLIRTTKVADELTASAQVRGMKLEGKYNPFYEIKMHYYDYLALIIIVIAAAGIFYLDFYMRRIL